MKSDLDRLMKERNLGAFMVLGDSGNNPAMNYLTGGIHLEHAIVLKRRRADDAGPRLVGAHRRLRQALN